MAKYFDIPKQCSFRLNHVRNIENVNLNSELFDISIGLNVYHGGNSPVELLYVNIVRLLFANAMIILGHSKHV